MSEMMVAVDIVAREDVIALEKAEENYGDSWKKRGGVGAFMMLARKWDRLEKQVEDMCYDVFEAIREDGREEGVIDDVRDLRRYLMLVEAEILRTAKTQITRKELIEELEPGLNELFGTRYEPYFAGTYERYVEKPNAKTRSNFDEDKELFLECGDEWKKDSVRQT